MLLEKNVYIADYYKKFNFITLYIFDRLECVGYSFNYVTHMWLLKDVWIPTQRATIANRRATNLASPVPEIIVLG